MRIKTYSVKKLDKACFQHDIAYADFKDLSRKTTSDKASWNKAFDISKNSKYDVYRGVFALMVFNFFDDMLAAVWANKYASAAPHIGTDIDFHFENQKLADYLHKPIIWKFKK